MPDDHKHRTTQVEPQAEECQECGQERSLRVCTTCGHVGCCDSSQGHAREHHEETGHEVIHELPQDDGFTWCYVCDEYLD